MLQALVEPRTQQELSDDVALPLFRIRSGLRELAGAGLVAESEGVYRLTEAGASRLADDP